MLQIMAHTEVEGMHAWLDAPDEYFFLRAPHRHKFIINGLLTVTHANRDVEFIQLGARMKEYLRSKFPEVEGFPGLLNFRDSSCEMLAQLLATHFNLDACTVKEDGEGGAMYVRQL